MVICPATNQTKAVLFHRFGQGARIADDLGLIFFETILKGFLEADGFGGDHMHEWPALNARERLRIDLFGILLFAENQAAARTPESLVSGRGDKISVSNGTGMQTGRDEAGDVGDVGHEISADLPSNLAHPLKIDDARISARSDGDHARLVLARHLRQ